MAEKLAIKKCRLYGPSRHAVALRDDCISVVSHRGAGTSLLTRMVEDARMAGSNTKLSTILSGSCAAAMYGRLGFVTFFTTRRFVPCP
jgi:hypothetical protein